MYYIEHKKDTSDGFIMRKSVTILKKCRACRSGKLFTFLDLGQMPIPNGFLEQKQLAALEKKYQLSCMLCENCGLVQLTNMVNPSLMFKNYVYVPSESKTMMNNFSNLSYQIISTSKLGADSLVVDIGSNDGSLLSFFKNYGTKILGVDPAENLAKIAEMKGIPTEIKMFDLKSASYIKKKYGSANVICATNVVAHVNNLHNFIKAINHLLSEDGLFVTEFPYLVELIKNNEFDTIYHEHLSYFSLKPWLQLVEANNLEIIDVRKLPIHGGSLRLVHRRKRQKKRIINNDIKKLLLIENSMEIYKKETFVKFVKRIDSLGTDLMKVLLDLKRKKNKIVGYGAAAKGNILTNYFKIDSNILDYIVDSTPYKQGLFTPGMHIPVYNEGHLSIDKPDYVLILAWNFSDEIIEKEKEYLKNGGKFIVPIPKIKIIS